MKRVFRTAFTRRIAALAAFISIVLIHEAGAQSLTDEQKRLSHGILKQLIETDTTHSSGSTTAAATLIRQHLLEAGFPAGDLILAGPQPKRMNLLVRYRGSSGSAEKPVLFLCHLDVVEAKRSDWTLDPFVLTEKDGFFYGRGTQDMKGSDAAVLTSLILLKQEGFVPRRDILVAFTADEEGGPDNGVAYLLKSNPEILKAAFVINPDAGGPVLRDGKPAELDMEATEKLYADYHLEATSAGGHSSLPRPDNPIYELANALSRLERSPFPFELNPVTRAYLQSIAPTQAPERKALIQRLLATPMDTAAAEKLSAGDPHMNAVLRTTCVATLISGGHAPNALPGSATANVNCRILPGHSPAEVMQQLTGIFNDPKLTVQWQDNAGVTHATAATKGAMPPPPLRDDVMAPIRKATKALFGDVPILPTMETGASDSIFTLGAGIPSYGVNGIAIDEGDERAHGRDERIRVASYDTGVAFQLELMKALASE